MEFRAQCLIGRDSVPNISFFISLDFIFQTKTDCAHGSSSANQRLKSQFLSLFSNVKILVILVTMRSGKVKDRTLEISRRSDNILHFDMNQGPRPFPIVNAVILPGETRRVRILIEKVDPIRETEYASSPFASHLARDFLDPLELYYQDDKAF
jgi:hypothetical protein